MTQPTAPASTLAAHDITTGYGDHIVLRDLTFQVPHGRFTAIIGPNGCGKSTLVKTLGRTLAPRSGRIELDGSSLRRYRSRALAQRLALLPQDPVTPDGVTVRSLVARGRHPYHSPLRQWSAGDDEAITHALEVTGTQDLPDAPLEQLSGGQRQRVWIAMVLAQDTDFVLLDEPTSFLDISHQIDVLHLCQDMRERGRTVVAVLHDLNQAARYADELVVMHEGRIVTQGDPAGVLSAELVREVFDLEAVIAPDPQTGDPMVVPVDR